MLHDDLLGRMPLVAILRGIRPECAVDVGRILFEADIGVIEVPLNSPNPFDSIANLSAALGASCLLGAGTVLDSANVRRAHDAGARLIVAPNTNPDVISAALERKMIMMPGFATPTEAFACVRAGATSLKLFPASTFGPGYLRALRSVLPADIRVYAVGGVGAEQVADWLAAGASGFGFGSELYRPDHSHNDIAARARRLVEAVRRASDAQQR
jgi:2-dehydro-3-deoxyphosphogalactonate aldolase